MTGEYSIILRCSNCNEELVDVWVRPGPTYKLRAKCPHCGDYSYWKEIKGKFALGDTANTDIGPITYEENLIEVSCRKK